MDHAVLSPSGSKRWLTCTRSARLEQEFENVESEAAREGTLAHSICEALLKGYKKSGVALLTLEEYNFFKEQEFYNEAMLQYCEGFAQYVLSFYSEGDLLYIEEKLDLSNWAPESFGRLDDFILKIKEKHLHIFDYKFGKGVEVLAYDNSQLKIYALGVVDLLDFLGYEIDKVTLHIYQPRIFNENPPYTMLLPDLLYWGRNTLKPKAILAFNGEGEFVAGEHCFFCNAKGACKALADYNLELLKLAFTDPDILNDAETVDILSKRSIFESWIKAVAEYALKQALDGKKWPGYKLVEGKSNRVYTDEVKVLKLLTKHLPGKRFLTDPQLLGITELTKVIGTENFNIYVNPYLRKPMGAPTLATLDDTRPVFNRTAKEFNDGWIDEELTWENL